MDQEPFAEQVRDALARFHDRAYLQALSLARLLLSGPLDGQEGARLQRLLLDAIEELRSPVSGQSGMPELRRYDYLYLHYVEGLTHAQVAQRLGISYRQGHRDHHEAVEALSGLLWSRAVAQQSGSTAETDERAPKPSAGGPGSLLETALLRLGRASEEAVSELPGIIDAVLETVGGLAAGRKVRVHVSTERALPGVAMSGDVVRHALLNVLSYALEITTGEEIELRVERDGLGVWVSLIWTAPAPSTLDDRATLEERGGPPEPLSDTRLLVGKRLLEMQGGSLQLTYRPGSTGQNEGFVRNEGFMAVAQLRLPASGPVAVLVIDDDPDFVQLLQRYLRGHPYRVLHATNANRALELAAAESPQIVVLDVLMPTQDGWTVLRQLRHLDQTRSVPVIICSVLSDRALARSLGATHFLTKPVTQLALLRALRDCQVPAPASQESPGGSDRARPRRATPDG